VLYGSEARGTAHPDSDVDLLVLLRGPVSLGKDLKTIIDALYPLQWLP
jgi:predicted nucleotidyltransferase